MSTPELPPVETPPKIAKRSPVADASAASRPSGLGETLDPPGLYDPLEPLVDIIEPVPDAIQQLHFDLAQPQQAPHQQDHMVLRAPAQETPAEQTEAQETMRQQPDPQPARDMPEGSAVSRPVEVLVEVLDGTEPVDHKDPDVVQQFRKYFGVTMTFQQVMELFEKGEAPPTFVQSGKVMAFDTLLYSYDEFTGFYGNVAGAEAWNFAVFALGGPRLRDLLVQRSSTCC